MSMSSPHSLTHLLQDLLCAYQPDDILAVGEQGSRTVHEFLQDVAAVAQHIPPRTQPDDQDILLTCQDRYHLAVVMLAAWQQQRVVAFPPNAREQTLQGLSARCAMTLHDGALSGRQGDQGDQSDQGGQASHDIRTWLNHPARASALSPIRAEQKLVTIYTSGSTGEPTACRKTALQLIGEGATLQQTFQLGRESCVLATVPAHHIYGMLFSIMMPLAAGARFVRETPLLMPVVEDKARRHHADVLVSVPPHLRVLAESELSSLASIQRVFSSGAPLPDPTAHSLQRRFGVAVLEVLGSTETGGFAYRRADSDGARFQPFPGVTISADSEQQLYLRSPLLDRRITQPMTCPDRIEFLPDGSFKHLGRSDGVIKVGGTRVSLPELETRVRQLAGVKDVAALAVDAGSARGQEIWLVVATEYGRELPDLRGELLRFYEPVLLPRRIRFLEALPREATGKLMRASLLELFRATKSESMQP